MKIKKITSTYRNDYCALMVCEHCGHEQKDDYGYNDANYHENVIPRMKCNACGKDRSGSEPAQVAA